MRYSLAEVEALFDDHKQTQYDDVPSMGERLGMHRGAVKKLRARGLSWTQADQVAAHLGLHPSLIWPSWFDDALADPLPCCAWCGKELDRYRFSCAGACAHWIAVERRNVSDLPGVKLRRRLFWARLTHYRKTVEIDEAAA